MRRFAMEPISESYGGFRYSSEKDSGLRNSVEGIPLDGLDAVGAGNPRTFGIEFDAIAPNLRVAGNEMQRSSLSYAGVDHRSRTSEGEQRAKLFPSLSGNG